METHQQSLEILRYAATHRLRVDVGYNGTRRLVEPYALQQTKNGMLIRARRADTGELRSYRLDRITEPLLTQQQFAPLFATEMTAGGPLVG